MTLVSVDSLVQGGGTSSPSPNQIPTSEKEIYDKFMVLCKREQKKIVDALAAKGAVPRLTSCHQNAVNFLKFYKNLSIPNDIPEEYRMNYAVAYQAYSMNYPSGSKQAADKAGRSAVNTVKRKNGGSPVAPTTKEKNLPAALQSFDLNKIYFLWAISTVGVLFGWGRFGWIGNLAITGVTAVTGYATYHAWKNDHKQDQIKKDIASIPDKVQEAVDDIVNE